MLRGIQQIRKDFQCHHDQEQGDGDGRAYEGISVFAYFYLPGNIGDSEDHEERYGEPARAAFKEVAEMWDIQERIDCGDHNTHDKEHNEVIGQDVELYK